MKTLVVFYSRTGTTRKVALKLAEKLGAEVEEIKDTVDRKGIIGFIKSGFGAVKKRLTVLETIRKNPADFDLVVVGTPVWASNLSVPVRTYLENQKGSIKSLALFCCMGGSGDDKAAMDAEGIVGKKLVALAGITTKEIVKDEFSPKLESFVSEITK